MKNPGRTRFSGFSKSADTIPNMLSEKTGVKNAVETSTHKEDEPLPGTLTFVLSLGVAFAILWFAMFLLLRARW